MHAQKHTYPVAHADHTNILICTHTYTDSDTQTESHEQTHIHVYTHENTHIRIIR